MSNIINAIEKNCEYCGRLVYSMHLGKNVKPDEIKVWHYNCRIEDKLIQDDLGVICYHCTISDMDTENDIVVSFMTKNSIDNIDVIYPNTPFVIMSEIIRTPYESL